jgi:hypothetical protein
MIVCAADTVFRPGDVHLFRERFGSAGVAGAIAVREDPPPGTGRPAIDVDDGWYVERIGADDSRSRLSGAPLWGVGGGVVGFLRCDREPYELESSFRAAIEAGERIAAIEIGKTRDLTHPLDLVEENFPYLTR